MIAQRSVVACRFWIATSRNAPYQDVERRVSNCFVAVTGDGVVAAHCTFAATSPPLTDLDPDRAKRLPRYPSLPAALARRLAVDERFKG